jgi:hypothetical protein
MEGVHKLHSTRVNRPEVVTMLEELENTSPTFGPSHCSTLQAYWQQLLPAEIEVSKLKLKLIYDRQSVGQSVLVSGTHLGPVTNFYFSLKFPSDFCVFVIL